MSLPLVVRPEATEDIAAIRDYLEAQEADLGDDFLQRLRTLFTNIESLPYLYGLVGRQVRAARLKKFTYVVYYRVRRDRVEVLAVAHGSHDASAWRSRL